MGKRYIVTGGAGFIGSHLVDLLIADPEVDFVMVLDKFTYAGDRRNIEQYWGKDKRFNNLAIDITDVTAVERVLAMTPTFDGVFHLAAESHVDRSIAAPLQFIMPNIYGAVNVMLQCCLKDIRCIIVSTDEVYGDSDERGEFKEDMSLEPSSPYSWSKASADMFQRVIKRTYPASRAPIVTRGCNHFGPRQQWEKFIPRVIMAGIEGQAAKLYGDGMQLRTWLHVKDGARALYHVMQHGEDGAIYNLGVDYHYGQTTKNRWLARRLLEFVHPDKEPVFEYITDRPGHDRAYLLDPFKLWNIGPAGWKPELMSFDEALKQTVEWYRLPENFDWVLKCRQRDKEFEQRNYANR